MGIPHAAFFAREIFSGFDFISFGLSFPLAESYRFHCPLFLRQLQ
jgi:hypothetical protein